MFAWKREKDFSDFWFTPLQEPWIKINESKTFKEREDREKKEEQSKFSNWGKDPNPDSWFVPQRTNANNNQNIHREKKDQTKYYRKSYDHDYAYHQKHFAS